MDPQSLFQQADNALQRIGSASVRLLFGFGIFFAVFTSFRGGNYYYNWGRELGLFTFGSSLQYFTAGLAAFICFLIIRHLNKSSKTSAGCPWLWLAMFPAFTLAACDETLMWHEKISYKIVNQFPILNHLRLGNVPADSLFVMSLALGGIVFTVFFIKELRAVPKARLYYLAGLALLLLAGAIDYLPQNILQRRLPFGTEELSEYFSGTCFTISFILYALDRFRLVISNWLDVPGYEDTPHVSAKQSAATRQEI